MRQKISGIRGSITTAFLVLAVGLPFWPSIIHAQEKVDWRALEKELPARLVVDPDSHEFGYSFETQLHPATVPEPFLTGGADAVRALKNALAGVRIDSVVGLTLLARLGDREAGRVLSAKLLDRKELARLGRRTAAALPMVLRYHTPDNEWPPLFIEALKNSPSPVDTTILVCLTKFDLLEAEPAYFYVFPRVDSVSQRRIIDRMTSKNKDDRLLWNFFFMTTMPSVQGMLLDRLEQMQSPLWPAKADSLARVAVGDVACRVLSYASPTDTGVYRPLMRMAIATATAAEKECILHASLQLSAEGDKGALPMLEYRFHDSDMDTRIVTALSICRLGGTKGIGACIRLGLKDDKYRDEVIKALESATGLAYGGDQEKWEEWFDSQHRY
jgi:hypothetical protein